MSRIWAVQHLASEPLGLIEDALRAKGVEAEYIRVFDGDSVPAAMTADGLIVMGGSMGAYEQNKYPFLSAEIRLIESAIAANRPVLGICLGSQLLAKALGAEVRKAERKEIGWFPVALTEAGQSDRLFSDTERRFQAFHWHGDVFDLPEGCAPLASSEQTPHQAFAYKERAYGLLFHLEADLAIITGMINGFSQELNEEGLDGAMISAQTSEHLEQFQRIGGPVFQRWVELIG